MNKNNIIGRNAEISILNEISSSNQPEFLALYGRRRIGKTYMIRSYFASREDCIFFNATGAKNIPMKEQIKHFTSQIKTTFYSGADLMTGKNWDTAFTMLTDAINTQTPPDKKIILFIDELPWMATRRSKLLENIDYYWNQFWSNDKRIKLIVCGSSASWIIDKIINARGGLHNRVTREINLEPFNLPQVREFLQAKNINLNNQQILQIYMTTGGVPFYLNKIKKGDSATQNIENLAFRKKAFFVAEFDNLFASLFDNSDQYIELVKILAQSRYGIGERKLLEQLGKKAVGAKGKKMLNHLEQAGFIQGFKPLYHKRKGIYYRVIDEYVIFYLKWIEPIRAHLTLDSLEAGYWEALQNSAQWYSWQGYTFEAICYKHILQIKRALNLPPTALASAWRYAPTSNSNERGAQIDLLFDRRDNAITICEIKYSNEPFVITKDIVQNLSQKLITFKKQTGNTKQLFIALVSSSGVKNNFYAEDFISQVVTLDNLFETNT